jgi:titin
LPAREPATPTAQGRDRTAGGPVPGVALALSPNRLRISRGSRRPTALADRVAAVVGVRAGEVVRAVLASALPALTGPTTINGWSQGGPGYAGPPLIQLNGAGAGAGANGLVLRGAGSVARGLVISNFGGSGVVVQAPGCVIAGCFIGTSADGTAAAANHGHGVLLMGAAASNRVGGTAAADANVISGNFGAGVAIAGAGARGNVVQGNVIGLRRDGNTGPGLGNRLGVWVTAGATGNVIGGAAGNTISANWTVGVLVSGAGTLGNVLANNRIGTDPGGAAARGNGTDGVLLGAGARANTLAGNVISGNGGNGVSISGAGVAGNVLRGNVIGTNAGGSAALANALDGVRIGEGASENSVGGAAAGWRNLISGNGGSGVEITGGGTRGNRVQGDFIGTNATGAAALRNSVDGVFITGGASYNTVGGSGALARNVISANGYGVVIYGGGTAGNLVQGNFIGTTVFGNTALCSATTRGISTPRCSRSGSRGRRRTPG